MIRVQKYDGNGIPVYLTPSVLNPNRLTWTYSPLDGMTFNTTDEAREAIAKVGADEQCMNFIPVK